VTSLAPPRGYTLGLLLLTASTGAVDAVSYLALDRVFTGNMTGNVLFIGFALVGVAGIPLLNNVIALLGFVAGSIVGGRIVGRGHPAGLPTASVATLAAGAVVLLGLASIWSAGAGLPSWAMLAITALLAAVMGAQVSAVKPIGNSDITTIVITSTLANLSRESRLGGGRGQRWFHRLSAIVFMGIGATLGAWSVLWLSGPIALFVAAGIFTAASAVMLVTARRHPVA